MLPRSPNEYLFLGFVHIELQQTSGDQPLRTSESTGPLDRLDWYLDALVRLGLSTTLTAAWRLQNLRVDLSTHPPDELLSDNHAGQIRTDALMLRETLKAETLNMTLYEVSGKRFDTKALLSNLPSLMRAGSYNELPLLAAFDLHEAATCIAYERATAAAFHSLRATEKVLRHYYSCVVVRNRIRGQWLWKRMLEELEKPRRVRQPDPAVLEHLDSIRKRFRNPTQHPEKVYDSEEAQNLFGQCLSVIEAMVNDVPWQLPADSVQSWVDDQIVAPSEQ